MLYMLYIRKIYIVCLLYRYCESKKLLITQFKKYTGVSEMTQDLKKLSREDLESLFVTLQKKLSVSENIQVIRSETCKVSTNFHHSFNDILPFILLNRSILLPNECIVSENNDEIVVSKDYKEFFCKTLNKITLQ